MSTEAYQIIIGGLRVDVVRKPIKNLHLGVYPPHGRIRVAAPLTVSDDAVRLAVVSRMGWIKRQRSKFEAQPRQSARKYVSGESHYFLGHPYRLRVVEGARSSLVLVKSKRTLELHVSSGADIALKKSAFDIWYRAQLRARLGPIVEKWAVAMGVQEPAWGIRLMRTKWGACNSHARRIWVNLELIKKPPACLEYIVAHEMAHLLERNHSAKFISIMDQALPTWRMLREELNAEPLRHEEWGS